MTRLHCLTSSALKHMHASFASSYARQSWKKNPKNSQSISLYNQRHWKQNFFFLNQTKLKRLYLAFEAILKLFHAEGYSSAPQTPLTAKAKYLGTYGPAED